jgi:hypothetical protein
MQLRFAGLWADVAILDKVPIITSRLPQAASASFAARQVSGW